MAEQEEKSESATGLIEQGLKPAQPAQAATAATTAPLSPAAEAPAGFVKAEDVQAMIDSALNKRAGEQKTLNVRERFIREKMADIPVRFQEAMPNSADLAELAKAEQEIRKDVQVMCNAWLKEGGYVRKTLDGSPGVSL